MWLLREVEISLKVAESDASWETKLGVLVKRHEDCISPLIKKCGVQFEFRSPAAGYEDDVRAYADALAVLKRELDKLPPGCFDYQYVGSARAGLI